MGEPAAMAILCHLACRTLPKRCFWPPEADFAHLVGLDAEHDASALAELHIGHQKIDDDPMALLASLLVMQRAHEESKTKAIRLGEVWGKKRANAQATTQVMSARVPAWLRVGAAEAFTISPEWIEQSTRGILQEAVYKEGLGAASLR
ncbi:hypothetical protein [Methylorubrum salsuginis]|nr:hypothetical protein [Methylorubrum salsuginis]